MSKTDEYCRKKFVSIIEDNCSISEKAIVPSENIKIGKNVIIEAGVVLIGHVEIGDNSIIHSGSVIGAQGNDFKRIGDELIRTSQVGGVVIDEGVEIDPNCCIERPAFPYENTYIGKQTKIGALSFLAHGVSIGNYTQIKGMVNIAGYTSIGNNVYVGPGVVISIRDYDEFLKFVKLDKLEKELAKLEYKK